MIKTFTPIFTSLCTSFRRSWKSNSSFISWAWIIVYLLSSNFIQAQAPKIAASLDRYQIEIGEQVQLKWSVEHPSNVEVQFPVLNLDGDENVEVAEVQDIVSKEENGLIQKTQTILIQAWDTGQYVIPSVRFAYSNSSNPDMQAEIATEELAFFVISPLLKDVPPPANPEDTVTVNAELKDIKGIKEVPFTFQDAIPYLLIGLVALLLVGGLYYWWRKRKQKENEVAAYVPPPRPAHEVAFEKLHLLEESKYWQKGAVKKYYSELTDIVREYIEGRYGVQALESTTDEILEGLKKEDFEENLWRKLQDMLQTADLVKFAKARPAIERHSEFLKEAKEIVRLTKKKVILEEENPSEEQAQESNA